MLLAVFAMILATTPEITTEESFAGPPRSLRQLVVAARTCGFPDAKITAHPYHRVPVVVIARSITDMMSGPGGCVLHWIEERPRLKLTAIYPPPPPPLIPF